MKDYNKAPLENEEREPLPPKDTPQVPLTVTNVRDGDTVDTVDAQGKKRAVRNNDIQSFESNTAKGQRQKRKMQMLLGDQATLHSQQVTEGVFGRSVANNRLDTGNDTSVDLEFMMADIGIGAYWNKYQQTLDPTRDEIMRPYYSDTREGEMKPYTPLTEAEFSKTASMLHEWRKAYSGLANGTVTREDFNAITAKTYSDENIPNISAFRRDAKMMNTWASMDSLERKLFMKQRNDPDFRRRYNSAVSNNNNVYTPKTVHNFWDKASASLNLFSITSSAMDMDKQWTQRKYGNRSTHLSAEQLTHGVPQQFHTAILDEQSRYGDASAITKRDITMDRLDSQEIFDDLGFMAQLGYGALGYILDPTSLIAGGVVAKGVGAGIGLVAKGVHIGAQAGARTVASAVNYATPYAITQKVASGFAQKMTSNMATKATGFATYGLTESLTVNLPRLAADPTYDIQQLQMDAIADAGLGVVFGAIGTTVGKKLFGVRVDGIETTIREVSQELSSTVKLRAEYNKMKEDYDAEVAAQQAQPEGADTAPLAGEGGINAPVPTPVKKSDAMITVENMLAQQEKDLTAKFEVDTIEEVEQIISDMNAGLSSLMNDQATDMDVAEAKNKQIQDAGDKVEQPSTPEQRDAKDTLNKVNFSSLDDVDVVNTNTFNRIAKGVKGLFPNGSTVSLAIGNQMRLNKMLKDTLDNADTPEKQATKHAVEQLNASILKIATWYPDGKLPKELDKQLKGAMRRQVDYGKEAIFVDLAKAYNPANPDSATKVQDIENATQRLTDYVNHLEKDGVFEGFDPIPLTHSQLQAVNVGKDPFAVRDEQEVYAPLLTLAKGKLSDKDYKWLTNAIDKRKGKKLTKPQIDKLKRLLNATGEEAEELLTTIEVVQQPTSPEELQGLRTAMTAQESYMEDLFKINQLAEEYGNIGFTMQVERLNGLAATRLEQAEMDRAIGSKSEPYNPSTDEPVYKPMVNQQDRMAETAEYTPAEMVAIIKAEGLNADNPEYTLHVNTERDRILRMYEEQNSKGTLRMTTQQTLKAATMEGHKSAKAAGLRKKTPAYYKRLEELKSSKQFVHPDARDEGRGNMWERPKDENKADMGNSRPDADDELSRQLVDRISKAQDDMPHITPKQTVSEIYKTITRNTKEIANLMETLDADGGYIPTESEVQFDVDTTAKAEAHDLYIKNISPKVEALEEHSAYLEAMVSRLTGKIEDLHRLEKGLPDSATKSADELEISKLKGDIAEAVATNRQERKASLREFLIESDNATEFGDEFYHDKQAHKEMVLLTDNIDKQMLKRQFTVGKESNVYQLEKKGKGKAIKNPVAPEAHEIVLMNDSIERIFREEAKRIDLAKKDTKRTLTRLNRVRQSMLEGQDMFIVDGSRAPLNRLEDALRVSTTIAGERRSAKATQDAVNNKGKQANNDTSPSKPEQASGKAVDTSIQAKRNLQQAKVKTAITKYNRAKSNLKGIRKHTVPKTAKEVARIKGILKAGVNKSRAFTNEMKRDLDVAEHAHRKSLAEETRAKQAVYESKIVVGREQFLLDAMPTQLLLEDKSGATAKPEASLPEQAGIDVNEADPLATPLTEADLDHLDPNVTPEVPKTRTEIEEIELRAAYAMQKLNTISANKVGASLYQFTASGTQRIFQLAGASNSTSKYIAERVGSVIQDLATSFQKSSLTTSQYVGTHFTELGMGYQGTIERKFTAGIIRREAELQSMKLVAPQYVDAINQYAESKGKGTIGKLSAQEAIGADNAVVHAFNIDMFHVQELRRQGKSTDHIHESVTAFADKWDKYMEHNHNKLTDAGIQGFTFGKVKKNYIPHIWQKAGLQTMLKTKGEDEVIQLLVKGYTSAANNGQNTLSPADIQSAAERQLEWIKGRTEEVDQFMPYVDGRAQRRLEIDTTVEHNGMKITDLLDTEVLQLGHKYTNRMAGWVGISKSTDGAITSEADILALRGLMEQEALDKGIDATKDLNMYDDVINMLFGRPVRGGLAPELHALRDLAALTQLGGKGTAQVIETGQVLTRSLLNLFSNPRTAMSMFFNDKGKVSQRYIDEMQDFSAVNNSLEFNNRQSTDLEQADADAEISNMRKAGQLAVHYGTFGGLKAPANRLLGKMNLFNMVQRFQNRFVQVNMTSNLVKYFAGEKNVLSEARLKDMGILDDFGNNDRMKEMFSKHTTYTPEGRIDSLNLDKWDADVREQLSLASTRDVSQQVQHTIVGELPVVLLNPVAKLLAQYREIAMVAQNKSLARNMAFADGEAVLGVSMNIAFSGLVRYAKFAGMAGAGYYIMDESWSEPTGEQMNMQQYIMQAGVFPDMYSFIFDGARDAGDGKVDNTLGKIPVLSLIEQYGETLKAATEGDAGATLDSAANALPLSNTAYADMLRKMIHKTMGKPASYKAGISESLPDAPDVPDYSVPLKLRSTPDRSKPKEEFLAPPKPTHRELPPSITEEKPVDIPQVEVPVVTTTRPFAPTQPESKDYPKGELGDFMRILKARESSNDYTADNKRGYIGAYQFGKGAFQDTGYKDSKGNWTGKDGIKSKEDWFNSPDVQDKAMEKFTKQNKRSLKHFGANKHIGKTFAGTKITALGMLASAHLIGAKRTADMLDELSKGIDITKVLFTSGKRKGQPKYADGNNKFGTEYIDLVNNKLKANLSVG